MELILATVKDVDKIIAIQREGFQLLYERYQDEYSPYLETKERIIEKLQRPFCYYFFIQENKEIVGFLRIQTDEQGKHAWLGTTVILPIFQKNGYAFRAIKKVEEMYTSIHEWSLYTILQEDHLVRLYKKLGYEGFKVEKETDEMDLFFMKKITNHTPIFKKV